MSHVPKRIGWSIAVALLMLSAHAEEGSKAKPSGKSLAPFTFGPVIAWARDSDQYEQKSARVCLDLMAYLNHPRSNALFKPDGTLEREGERIKSVQWETLDKKQYRDGFMVLLNAEKHPNIKEGRLKIYADPEWILQRTVAHPLEFQPKPSQSERWLYRLVLLTPHTRPPSDPTSRVELPTWFPSSSLSWLGDARGARHVNDIYGEYGGAVQWIDHAGKTYAVRNSTSDGGKDALPKYLKLDVNKLIFDPENHSFLRGTCALRARNNE